MTKSPESPKPVRRGQPPPSAHEELAGALRRWLVEQNELLIKLPLCYQVAPLHAMCEALNIPARALRSAGHKRLMQLFALLSSAVVCEEHAELRAQLEARLPREERVQLRRLRQATLAPWEIRSQDLNAFVLQHLTDPSRETVRARTLLDQSVERWPGRPFLGWEVEAGGETMAIVAYPMERRVEAAGRKLGSEATGAAWVTAVFSPNVSIQRPVDAFNARASLALDGLSVDASLVEETAKRLDFDVRYSRWANPYHKTFKRMRDARHIVAQARDAEDLTRLCDAIRRLRYELLSAVEVEQRSIRTPSHPALEHLAPTAAVLASLRCSEDGVVASASRERLLRHPLAMFDLSEELLSARGWGRLTPIGVALRWAEADLSAPGALEVYESLELYESEQRWLATFGAPLQEEGVVDDVPDAALRYDDVLQTLHGLYDPKVLDVRLERAGLEGKVTRRLIGALGVERPTLAALPKTAEGLRGLKGVGPRTLAMLTRALLEFCARWRSRRAGLAMRHIFRRSAHKTTPEASLREGLSELASMFEADDA